MPEVIRYIRPDIVRRVAQRWLFDINSNGPHQLRQFLENYRTQDPYKASSEGRFLHTDLLMLGICSGIFPTELMLGESYPPGVDGMDDGAKRTLVEHFLENKDAIIGKIQEDIKIDEDYWQIRAALEKPLESTLKGKFMRLF